MKCRIYGWPSPGTTVALPDASPGEITFARRAQKENASMLGTVLLIILILALIGSIPVYPYNAGWGYYPSGLIGTVLIIWLILVLIGRV